jgi:anti-anti-sigma factor
MVSQPATIDLSRVTYLDSTVLNILFALRRKFQEVPITLLASQRNVRKILQIAGFDKLFQIIDQEPPSAP